MKTTALIGHATALAYWHRVRLSVAMSRAREVWIGSAPIARGPSVRLDSVDVRPCAWEGSAADVASALLIPPTLPIHITGASAAVRTGKKGFVNHATDIYRMPAGSWLRAVGDICVASPELVFLQLSAELDLVDLIELGFMMCGTYTLRLAEDGATQCCPPLTTCASIGDYIAASEGARGLDKTRRALQFIRDGSNSPKETHTVMQLCLSRMLGGAGCDFPVLNVELTLGSRKVYPDFYWKKRGVVGEYNGSQHGDLERMLADARRANDMLAKDLKSFVVTKDHFASPEAFEDIEHVVTRLLGTRRENGEKTRRAKHALRSRLGDPARASRWASLLGENGWGRGE